MRALRNGPHRRAPVLHWTAVPDEPQRACAPFRSGHDARAAWPPSRFDVLVVGGGITGAGVALDAATPGLRTALVERDDFAAGTSSKSSKLVHGGLRYLQQGDVRLVYEALHERQRLRRNAPHLVKVLPFLIPILTKDGADPAQDRPGARHGDVDVRPHRRLRASASSTSGSKADAALAHMPTLPPRAAGRRRTSTTTPPPTTPGSSLDVARTAAAHGAVVANRCRGRRPRPRTPTAGSTAPSSTPAAGEIDGRAPRSSSTPPACGPTTSARSTRASTPTRSAGQGRPHHRAVGEGAQRHRRRHPGAEGQAQPVRRAVGRAARRHVRAHLHRHHRHRLRRPARRPAVHRRTTSPTCSARSTRSITTGVTADDVTGTWAGLRPLVKAADERPHRRPVPPPPGHVGRAGVITVTGGKLTTYREMAEDTVDERARAPRPRAAACRTKRLRAARRRGLRRRRRRRSPTPTSPTATAPRPATVEALIARRPVARRAARARARRTCGPRRSTRCATRWRRRSTTCCRGAPGPACSTATATRRGRRRRRRADRRRARVGRRRDRRARSPTTASSCAAERAAPAPEAGSTLRSTDAGRVTAPTPPIELDRHRRPRLGTRRRRRRRRRCSTRLRDVCATVIDRRRARRRGQPRLVAAGDALGARRPGRRAGRARSCRPTTDRRGRRGARASATTPRVPVTAAGGRSGVCGASVPVLGGVVLDLTALAGHRRRRRRRRCVRRRAAPARSATDLEARAARRARPHRRPLAAVRSTSPPSAAGSPAAAPASTRPATARSRTWSSGLEVVLADGTRRSAPAAAPAAAVGPDLNQLFVGSRGHARRHHPGVAARPPGAARRAAAPRTGSRRSPTGSRPAAAILAAGRDARPCCASTTRVESARGHGGDGTALRAARARRGRPGARRRHDGRRRRASAATPSTLDDATSSTHWLEHRNDVAALRGADPQGLRRRHDGDRRRRGRALPTHLRRRPRRRCSAVPHAVGRQLPPVAQLPRRRLPLLHVRRPRRRPTRSSRPTSALWDAGQRAVLGRRRQPVAPPRRRPQPGPLRGRGARRRPSTCSPPSRTALDPNGILNPGKLGLPVAVRRRRRGREPDAAT